MLIKRLLFILISVIALHFYGWTASAAVSPSLQSTGPSNSTALRIAEMKYYSSLLLKDYEKLSGKRLNLFERFSFKASQHRMKTMLKGYDKNGAVSVLQKISWLIKGLILGPIALLIGYIFLKNDERELIKWIWFGFAGWVVILAAILIAG